MVAAVLSPIMFTQEEIELPEVNGQVGKKKGSKVRYSPNLICICIFVAELVYYCKYAICCDYLFYSRKRKIVSSLYLLGGGVILMLIVLGLSKRRYVQRRQTLRQLLQRHEQSDQALLRYVMLNRQCSEEAAYLRIAAFVKEHSSSEDLNEFDRQSLLDKAGSLLMLHPDDIDKI